MRSRVASSGPSWGPGGVSVATDTWMSSRPGTEVAAVVVDAQRDCPEGFADAGGLRLEKRRPTRVVRDEDA